jgi:hypothetical protein
MFGNGAMKGRLRRLSIKYMAPLPRDEDGNSLCDNVPEARRRRRATSLYYIKPRGAVNGGNTVDT